MELNKVDAFARTLLYVEFPRHYVWICKDRKWEKRTHPGGSIGRISYVPPSPGDIYYLRMLLNHVRGPQSWKELKTFNGHTFETYKEVCEAMGLLSDDKEYVEAIEEANGWATGLVLQEDELKNPCLSDIEGLLKSNGSTLRNFPDMPCPDEDYVTCLNNQLIRNELMYDKVALQTEHATYLSSLTQEQHHVYDTVIQAVDKNEGGVFFVYGYGGTGKTFLWKTLTIAIRSRGYIVLNVASSGIASLLLDEGRTTHSRFSIPIHILENSVCSIDPQTDLAGLIKKTKLIIWDEAPMIHKHCFEALDKTMRDILSSDTPNSDNLVFGGKVVLFGGDFRQILPVIPKGTRSDIVNASLNSSYLWNHCRVLKLTVNMRLRVGSSESDLNEIKMFADWILKLGDGLLGEANDGEVDIPIPADLLIDDIDDPVKSLITFTYPNMDSNLHDPLYFQQRAILAPTHNLVNSINEKLLQMIPGEETIYLSANSICEFEQPAEFDSALISTEVLNNMQLSGLPNHILVLKVGTPVMLLRNIDQSNGLCNGTRLQVIKLGKHVIEAKVITGTNIGQCTLIPRLKMTPSDKRIPVRICRRQFPIVVCFAMTINKSQGQSLDCVGLYLPRPVFSHGQLYVVVSRIKSKKGLKILITDKDGNLGGSTTNVVFKEVLQYL
uniref:ATP-dependent DNA helicase PIF1-like n=1 Tax=Erigeron canadensis TaxID=72917 RepID=UPI001CB994CF|nr:ATP-dependent DNA helicase PIF1-like [Erigeron canadensis]